MRSFFRKLEILLGAIPLGILLAVSFFATEFRVSDSAIPENIIVSGKAQNSPLTSSLPEKSGERSGLLQLAVPGGGVPAVVVSRRTSEPLTLRLFRSSETCFPPQEIAVPAARFGREKYNNYHHFVFQRFLKHSLPVRAGPFAA